MFAINIGQTITNLQRVVLRIAVQLVKIIITFNAMGTVILHGTFGYHHT